MKIGKLKQLAIAAGLAIGVAVPALAVPQFTIDPSAIPGNTIGTNAPFNATVINGGSSELLTFTGNNASGSGWIQFGQFLNGASAVGPLTSGLNVDYGLYLTFQLQVSLTSGGAGQIGSNYAVTALTFQVFADKDLNTTFTAAQATGVPHGASVNGTTSDDILLAAGSLISGVAGFDALGGAFLNSIENFAICTGPGTGKVGAVTVPVPACVDNTGSKFFAQPNPFYSLAFDAFNNTSQGISTNADRTVIAIESASGTVDFNNVPEPATLALVGVALVGLGVAQRKRKSV